MRATTKAEYTIRDYQPQDEEHGLDFLSQVLQGWSSCPKKTEFWRWKHFANPFGASNVLVACNDRGDIIGLLAFMHWQIRLGSQLIQSVRITDSATHPAYRRLGISSTLRQRLVKVAQREGATLMFGFPNQDSLAVSLMSGGQLAGKIRLLIRVSRHRHFMTGLLRSRLKGQLPPHYQRREFFRQEPLPVESVLERRGELNRLLEQDQRFQNKSCRTERSWEYLRWRYSEHPINTYYTVYKEHRGELLGCVMFRTDTYHSLKGIVLDELLVSRPEKQLAFTLMKELLSVLNVDYVLTCFSEGSLHRRILGKMGFLRLPFRAYNLTVEVWDPEIGKGPLDLESWSLTPGELEEAWAWR